MNWPDHIPGINPMGTMFDSRGNKILHAEDEVTVGNNYYLITDRCICESFPDVNIVELMHCSIVNSVWRVYEVQAVSFSPDSARFFILYKLHLVKKPTDLHIIWPMTVEEGSISYHNADNLYIAYNGEDQISLQLMPCSAQSAQKEMSGYFQVQSNGFQQMVAFKWHNGQRNCSNHLMVWKNPFARTATIPDVAIFDKNEELLQEEIYHQLPPRNQITILARYDGVLTLKFKDKIKLIHQIKGGERFSLDVAIVEEKWKTDAAEKINIAAQKVEELEAQCKEKANTLKSLNSDIEDRRDKLQELQNEVAQNKILARESYSMVQEKIATAKHDVSSFLADMACYFPNSTVIANSSVTTCGDYVHGTALESDKVETFDSWESLVDELRGNLGCVGVAQEYENSFAAFLYATHRVRMPLLLAGYVCEEIGQALSVSVFGKYADILTCSGNCNLSMIHDAFSGEGILLIRNPFCGDWLNALLQETKTSHKQIIFCHPYAEDLAIEPQSLFNYMLPIFTDQITDSAPVMEDMIGAMLKPGEDDFEPAFERIVSNNVFSELGISKILQNKMQSLFASTQSITKVKEDSLIYRCILTSYAASAEKGEQLCRAIKGRIDLSQDIKKFIFRYFNYEEE